MLGEALDPLPQGPFPDALELEERLGDLHPPTQGSLQEFVAIGEVSVDRPQRHTGPQRDVLHRREHVSLHEQLVNRVQYGVGVAMAPRRTTVEFEW